MIFSPERKWNEVKLYYDKTFLEIVKTIKYLSVFLDENLNMLKQNCLLLLVYYID